MSGTPELVARARQTHVVVVGGGIAGLVAAWECAKIGVRVTLLEAAERLGGVVRGAELDGILVDIGAESYATRGGHVRAVIAELGLEDRIEAPATSGAWVAGVPGVGAAPMPSGGVLGIPANPFAEDVRRIIGWRGAWRAWVDRIRPPLTIGHERSLGRLVRTRMGERVLRYLVAPITVGVYSAKPHAVDVELAAPGLSTALTRAGSLAGAVTQLRGTGRPPGSAVESLRGGMITLVDALRERVEELGVEVRVGTRVTGLGRLPGGWAVRIDDGDAVDTATAVIVATPERAARALLGPHVPGLGEAEPPVEVEIVALLLDAPALDGGPRGTGVLTVPGSHAAKGLTHSTAKWASLAEAAGGRHIVRVSFGGQDEPPPTARLDDAAAATLALSEASALLGVDAVSMTLLAAHREAFVQAQPGSAIGQADAAAAAREAIADVPGLGAVGAWLSGTGLAQVIPDALAEAERVRSAALWSGSRSTPDAAATSPPGEQMPKSEYGSTLEDQAGVTEREESP